MGGPFRPIGLGIRPIGAAPDVTFDDVTIDQLTCTSIVASGQITAGSVSSAGLIEGDVVHAFTDMGSDGTFGTGGTTTFGGDVVMSAGKVLTLAAGSLAAPSLRFAGSNAGTGLSAATADAIVEGRAGVAHRTGAAGGMTFGVPVTVPAGTVSAPGLQFTGSGTNTGLYASTADEVSTARLGVEMIRIAASGGPNAISTLQVSGDLTMNGKMSINNTLRFGSTLAIQTTNYTATATDRLVRMSGTSLTLTLPATPTTNQMLLVKNLDATSLTVGRNGKNIDGAAADLTLLTGASAWLFYDGTGWYRMGN